MPLTSLVLTPSRQPAHRTELCLALDRIEEIETGPWTNGRLPVVVDCEDIVRHRALLEMILADPALVSVHIVHAYFEDVSELPSAEKRLMGRIHARAPLWGGR